MTRRVAENAIRSTPTPAASPLQVVIDGGCVRVVQDTFFVEKRAAKVLPPVRDSGSVHIACVVRATENRKIVPNPALDRFLAKHGCPVIEGGTAELDLQFIAVTGPQLGEFLRATTSTRMASAAQVALGTKRFCSKGEHANDLQIAAAAAYGALGGGSDTDAIIANMRRLANPIDSPQFESKRKHAAYAIAAFGAKAVGAREELVRTVNMGRRAKKLADEFRDDKADAFVVKAKKLLADISTPGSEAEKILERLASYGGPIAPNDEYKGLLPAYDAHHFLMHLYTTGRAARDVVGAIDRAVKAAK